MQQKCFSLLGFNVFSKIFIYPFLISNLGPRLNECKGLQAGNSGSGQTFLDQTGAPLNDPSRNDG